MPKVTNGKVSINLKLPVDMYNKWIEKAAALKILNMSEFIRQMVEKGIQHV